LIYALSAALRDEIEHNGQATLHLDLLPDFSLQRVQTEVSHPRGARSLSSHLQSRLGLKGVKANLLREALSAEQMHDRRCWPAPSSAAAAPHRRAPAERSDQFRGRRHLCGDG